jgi:putative ATPase
LKRKPYCLYNGQQYVSGGYHHGYPESRIILSQCAIYLATLLKASYLAIGTAQQLVKQTGDLPIPIHLRNAPTKLMKELGYGEEYKYSHDFANNLLTKNFYLM